ncbi:uncharacterized protein TRIADDRAFT_62199 [Trichoplax adhaerens]|uniref:Agenet domain-containing protein n=1 Tax=Trichoplax adhaerens TaxID=10228 RepID=B3SD43_TRIAD|nr:hypothetical protein TRIADDRAFT_62199 [Trichoplax adhaerens]EDV19388.1 hypothetical protein TRIADDRAFT_62199 [Trichoplax adhaerens]|eukprot:XP_002118163.1 hypothetical protein TRIADDRAFT_62199 [Trichoplax adhaerens]
MAYSVGQNIEIFWNNTWYPGVILEIGQKKTYLVSYLGWSDSFNEAIELSKIRINQDKPADENSDLKVGDKIEAEWGSSWYEAIIEEIKTCYVKVRYKNYSNNWDTWITNEKLRPAETNVSEASVEAEGSIFVSLKVLERIA